MVFTTHSINSATDTHLKLKRNEFLLDNQAEISVFHPSQLINIRTIDWEIRISGIGGVTLKVNNIGYLPGFFDMYASEDAIVNVICFSDVEDKFEITYIPQEAFIVHLEEDHNIMYYRKGKLYVGVLDDVADIYVTVEENESVYTKTGIKRSQMAYELVKNAGYPSM